jgi:hypothetical protein
MQSTTLLKVFAGLFSLLAISNLLKPLTLGADVGFVLFGQRLSGTANMIAGPMFGVYLAVYAFAIVRMRRYAFPLGVVYAAYVLTNLILWTLRMPADAQPSIAFSLVYSVVAVGVSSGSALLLYRTRAQLH